MAKEVKEDLWTIEDSENLYRVKLWGESYFHVNMSRTTLGSS